MYIILKNQFHIARLSVLIGFVQKIGFSIINVINLSADSKIEVRQQNLKAKKFTRKDLLNQDSKTKGRNKLAKLKHILSNINLLLTPDAQHHNVFSEVPIVGFTRGENS